jgi:hypothetical protein
MPSELAVIPQKTDNNGALSPATTPAGGMGAIPTKAPHGAPGKSVMGGSGSQGTQTSWDDR